MLLQVFSTNIIVSLFSQDMVHVYDYIMLNTVSTIAKSSL